MPERRPMQVAWRDAAGVRPYRRDPVPADWYEPVTGGWRPSVADIRSGCRELTPGRAARPVTPNSVFSAVLVLLLDLEGDPHAALIERSHRSRTNAGELAFPGGILRPNESPLAAALRETEEEVGVAGSDIEVLASLDEIATPSGFLIRPYVGLVQGRPDFVIDQTEVQRVVTASLAKLARPNAHRQLPYADTGVLLNHFDVGGLDAWGTTGDLLAQLLVIATRGRCEHGVA